MINSRGNSLDTYREADARSTAALVLVLCIGFVGCSSSSQDGEGEPVVPTQSTGAEEQPVADEAPASQPEECLLAAEQGPCEADIQAWHFDAESGTCQQFSYGGCEGNTNNFSSEEQCQARCAGAE